MIGSPGDPTKRKVRRVLVGLTDALSGRTPSGTLTTQGFELEGVG